VDTSSDPRIGAERNEALKFAVLLLLEKLSPCGNALRIFYVRHSTTNIPTFQGSCTWRKQTSASSSPVPAKTHRRWPAPRSVAPSEQRRLLEAFVAAAQNADMAALEALLAEDVVSYADGGGIVHAATAPVSGRKHVATFIAALSKWCWKGVTLELGRDKTDRQLFSYCAMAFPFGLTIDASAQGIDEIMWFLRPK